MDSLRWLDIAIIAAYFVGMMYIGLRSARRQKTTEDYFVAGRSIPAWAMGVSIFATLISSITFIAYPGNAFGGNWAELVPGFMVIIVLLLVGTIIIPFFRQVVKIRGNILANRESNGGRLIRVFSRHRCRYSVERARPGV